MISEFRIIENVGVFEREDATGKNIGKLCVIFAENGLGKTSLTAVLRSLADGSPIPITERRRLGTTAPPKVVVSFADPDRVHVFENGAWSSSAGNIRVFDDDFVNRNVYSGLSVSPSHRSGLHELVLGEQGVALAEEVRDLTQKIQDLGRDCARIAAAIPSSYVGGMGADEFCSLEQRKDIDQAIAEAKRLLASAESAEELREKPLLEPIALFELDEARLANVVASVTPGLDIEAQQVLQKRFRHLGPEAESWVHRGMTMTCDIARNECPFCAQDLADSPIASALVAYFGGEYHQHLEEIENAARELEACCGEKTLAEIQRLGPELESRAEEWRRYCDIPSIELDVELLRRALTLLQSSVRRTIANKKRHPQQEFLLTDDDKAALLSYLEAVSHCKEIRAQVDAANASIQEWKSGLEGLDVTECQRQLHALEAARDRYEPAVAAACQRYLQTVQEKADAEQRKTQARHHLDQHRQDVFPTYQNRLNAYLQRFGAGFEIAAVQSTNVRGNPSCTYALRILGCEVPITESGDTGNPSFKSTLSAGDRNTLALSFFFASIDLDARREGLVVVIDDPLSSLDEHRCMTTRSCVLELDQSVRQVIVLSHYLPFLCSVYDRSPHTSKSALAIKRVGTHSTVELLDILSEREAAYDQNHRMLREYFENGAGDPRAVAQAIRHVLETYCRVRHVQHYRPGENLGSLVTLARERVGTAQEFMPRPTIATLVDLNEYSSQYHHSGGAGWQTRAINQGELRTMVGETLGFVGS